MISMDQPSANNVTISRRRFTCQCCGRCCRRWHVYVAPAERARLAALAWPADVVLPPQRTLSLGGHDYLAHVGDCCLYLNPVTQRCRIHECFGYEHKPLGCRVYPLSIVTTFPAHFSALGRFDCPAVRANQGKLLADGMPEVRGFIGEMGLRGGFDDLDLNGLTEPVVRRLVGDLRQVVLDHPRLPVAARMVIANLAVNRWEALGPAFLNDVALDEVLPPFFVRLAADFDALQYRALGAIERWRFLSVFTAYLRRDEDLLGRGPGARLARTAAMVRILAGRANLRDLGTEHPDRALPGARLFTLPVGCRDPSWWELYLDLVRLRLETWQFLGRANYNLPFFDGLRALLFSFPLVLAAAKWSALARHEERCELEAADVDYAVGAIDHSLGRSAALQMGVFRTLQRQLVEPGNFANLVHALLPPAR